MKSRSSVPSGFFHTGANFSFRVCVLADSFHEAQQALRGLYSIAYFDVTGYVLGGGEERTEGVPLGELDDVLAAGVEVVDVREEDDRETGYIPGSHSLPFHRVATSDPDVPADRPLVTICESGPRAAIAASILRGRGYDARPVVGGGMADWRARGDTLAHSS